MLCLGVESSCDETAMALVDSGKLIHEVVASQADLHALFGGVVPELASREHYRKLGPLLDSLLGHAGVRVQDLDVVAAARGPGLLGGLIAGMSFAKSLALGTGARFLGVNHLHAHLMAPGLENELLFPALGLLISGGHTQLYRLDSALELHLLGRTLDDAAGEAFDKVARMLRLPYPGGKYIDMLGSKVSPDPDVFPWPYVDNQNLDFSFSGLKTAVSVYLQDRPGLRPEHVYDPEQLARQPEAYPELASLCASFNYSIAQTLRVKVRRALTGFPQARSLIVAGGVAANSMIRSTMQTLAKEHGMEVRLPRLSLCTDNGAMIAYAGWLLAAAGYRHDFSVDAIPRGRKIPWDYLVEDQNPLETLGKNPASDGLALDSKPSPQ